MSLTDIKVESAEQMDDVSHLRMKVEIPLDYMANGDLDVNSTKMNLANLGVAKTPDLKNVLATCDRSIDTIETTNIELKREELDHVDESEMKPQSQWAKVEDCLIVPKLELDTSVSYSELDTCVPKMEASEDMNEFDTNEKISTNTATAEKTLVADYSEIDIVQVKVEMIMDNEDTKCTEPKTNLQATVPNIDSSIVSLDCKIAAKSMDVSKSKASTGNKRDSDGSTEGFRGFDDTGAATQGNNVQPLEIIISDDECAMELIQPTPKAKRKIDCCNMDCTSSDDSKLRDAPGFVSAYFGQKTKTLFAQCHTGRVCDICYALASIYYEDMLDALRSRKPLFRGEFPNRNDTVVLSDSESDNEDTTPTVAMNNDMVKFINEHLKEIVITAVEDCGVNYQIDQAGSFLVEKVDHLVSICKETYEEQNANQRRLDQVRRDLYTMFSPKCSELNPVEIVDMEGPAVPFQRPITYNPAPGKGTKVAMKKVTQGVRVFGDQQTTSPALNNPLHDVVALEQVQVHHPLPPVGINQRPSPKVGDTMYAMKFGLFGIWVKAKVLEIVSKASEIAPIKSVDGPEYPPVNTYRVKFDNTHRKGGNTRIVAGRQLAYTKVCPYRHAVGTRVIAVFKDHEVPDGSYYAGVIAEPPKQLNKYRYLIFFDDGYTQYVVHEKILLVAESSRHVYDDVDPEARTFIKQYMEQYPERPMVKVALDQVIKTEWNGKWWLAKVIEIDCSLCNMNFLADARTEWLYRGSTRLAPLYNELSRANPRQLQGNITRHRGQGISTLKKCNMPYVEYTRALENDIDNSVTITRIGPSNQRTEPAVAPAPLQADGKPVVRAVAKKSTTKRPLQMMSGKSLAFSTENAAQNKNQSTLIPGYVRHDVYNVKAARQPKKFVPHQCGPSCILLVAYYPDQMKHCGPLVVPLLCGWRRDVKKFRGKKAVVYKAPCGRRIRNMDEMSRYLRVTKSLMGVDFFDFGYWVNCVAEFVLEHDYTHIQDLSYGVENMPVPCVNYINHELPEYVTYTAKREPVPNVFLNLDPEFITGCECTDGCQDKDKCACWQLTFAGTAFDKSGVVDNTIGYTHKRLLEPVLTGMYECNSRCKCSSTCSNRVVQNPMRCKLQVFKTQNRGWGIRSINDMPQGSFICIYAGRLLNEHEANEGGKNDGDEYLAELDYIEVVERLKEGYEDQVKSIFGEPIDKDDEDDPEKGKEINKTKKRSDDGDDGGNGHDSDEDFQIDNDEYLEEQAAEINESNSIRTRLRKRKGIKAKRSKQRTKKIVPILQPSPKVKSSMETRRASRDAEKDDGGSDSKDGECIVLSDDEDPTYRTPQSFAVTKEPVAMDGSRYDKPLSYTSIRHYFDESDMCYIMDAKTSGNIGRYLNHSCSPNVFVQNVFVDTHDLRFPWVAFFALTYIPASTELTWDYNYDIDSVPGKVLDCHCGSAECRGRLL